MDDLKKNQPTAQGQLNTIIEENDANDQTDRRDSNRYKVKPTFASSGRDHSPAPSSIDTAKEGGLTVSKISSLMMMKQFRSASVVSFGQRSATSAAESKQSSQAEPQQSKQQTIQNPNMRLISSSALLTKATALK
jgi:hypothetical protein